MKTKITLTLISALFFNACDGSLSDKIIELSESSNKILFIKTKSISTVKNYTSPLEGNYSNIYSLTPVSKLGDVKQVTSFQGASIIDLNVNANATKIIFTMRTIRSNRYQVYIADTDGKNVVALTSDPTCNSFSPVFAPQGKIIYTSSCSKTFDEYEQRPTENLYSMNLNGTDKEQISFNLSDDFSPFILNNGKFAYTRWEHHGPMNRFPLFSAEIDGSDTFLFYGRHKATGGCPDNFFQAQSMKDGRIVAIASCHILDDSGSVVLLSPGTGKGDPGNSNDMEIITPMIDLQNRDKLNGAFRNPYPLDEKHIIVSYTYNVMRSRREKNADYGLYVIDLDNKKLTFLYNDPEYNEIHAIKVYRRTPPKVNSLTRDKRLPYAQFLARDAYARTAGDGQLIPDRSILEIPYGIVTEGVPTRVRGAISLSSFERKRITGFMPINSDGSFAIQVDADMPFSLHTLMASGMAKVTKRTWIYGRSGEKIDKCAGCHAPRGVHFNATPDATFETAAIMNGDLNLKLDVSYCGFVKQEIAKSCIRCHNDNQNPPNLSEKSARQFTVAYENLLQGSHLGKRYVNAAHASQSYLAELLSKAQANVDHSQFAPDNNGPDCSRLFNGVPSNCLSTRRKWFYWIDLGAQFRTNQKLDCSPGGNSK